MSGVTSEQFLAFKALNDARFSCKEFKSDPIDEAVIDALVAVTQRAPTSFNSQPYRIVLVRDATTRAALAKCMTGSNGAACVQAPLVAVFCADTEVVSENGRLTALFKTNPNIPAFYLAIIPKYVRERPQRAEDWATRPSKRSPLLQPPPPPPRRRRRRC